MKFDLWSSFLAGLALCALTARAQEGGKAIGVAATFAPVTESAPGGNAALFVGVNQFSEDKTLQNLSFAVNDAIAQAHLFVLELKLVSPLNTYLAIGGEPTSEIAKTQLAELESAGVHRITAIKSSVLRTLQAVANIPKAPSDLLVVSVSSHGFEEAGQPYVMPADGIRGFLEDTAINLNSIEHRLRLSKASKRLLLVDACRERPTTEAKGAALPMTAAFRTALAASEGQAVLASCDTGQISFENPSLGQGVFTYFLLEALRGKATADERGYITLGSVSEYVAQAVQEWVTRNKPELERAAAQRPWFKGPKVAEEIPLAIDSGVQARETAFKTQVAVIEDALRQKINRHGAFNTRIYDELSDGLDQAQDKPAGLKLIKNSRDFLDGKMDEEVFVAYLEKVLEPPVVPPVRESVRLAVPPVGAPVHTAPPAAPSEPVPTPAPARSTAPFADFLGKWVFARDFHLENATFLATYDEHSLEFKETSGGKLVMSEQTVSSQTKFKGGSIDGQYSIALMSYPGGADKAVSIDKYGKKTTYLYTKTYVTRYLPANNLVSVVEHSVCKGFSFDQEAIYALDSSKSKLIVFSVTPKETIEYLSKQLSDPLDMLGYVTDANQITEDRIAKLLEANSDGHHGLSAMRESPGNTVKLSAAALEARFKTHVDDASNNGVSKLAGKWSLEKGVSSKTSEKTTGQIVFAGSGAELSCSGSFHYVWGTGGLLSSLIEEVTATVSSASRTPDGNIELAGTFKVTTPSGHWQASRALVSASISGGGGIQLDIQNPQGNANSPAESVYFIKGN